MVKQTQNCLCIELDKHTYAQHSQGGKHTASKHGYNHGNCGQTFLSLIGGIGITETFQALYNIGAALIDGRVCHQAINSHT